MQTPISMSQVVAIAACKQRVARDAEFIALQEEHIDALQAQIDARVDEVLDARRKQSKDVGGYLSALCEELGVELAQLPVRIEDFTVREKDGATVLELMAGAGEELRPAVLEFVPAEAAEADA